MGESLGIEVLRQDDFDLYRPEGDMGPLPTVILVHGAAPPGRRPRTSPLFSGYGRLLAQRGLAAAVLDVRYRGLDDWPAGTVWPPRADWLGTAEWLETTVQRIRDHAGVDGDQAAIWAFSGGGMLVGSWLAATPPWLRCLALTYPVLADQSPGSTVPAPADLVRPGRPVVLTRVGQEQPEYQATVDRFLARAAEVGASVDIIDVPDGRHGFDAFVPDPASCEPVRTAVAYVAKHLAGS
ncbi:dienelactone hydrolase [Nocardia transvalensis]|uniref:Dienelactone hydrolase n=1 Tax=Nocardia transvalensis TaxID=37333 RepID=A0A7W9PMX9_9NOCA|nr:hypothetical protein [Nocardia transvalensis]MBB5918895.1 dienelactone hydrolase [Nocardia transvalensis]